ncbi:MAG: FkbM family methyltransferase [Rhizobiales bacterium]|nr:FkbM family methyltransferase [Hyphomicrobiales bacterium]
MLSQKTMHFFGQVLASRPLDFPDMVRRRAIEALAFPPTKLATTYVGDVRFDVDMTLHALARKYYYQTHEMFLESVFRRHLAPGATFVDIGANMGYWSAFSASLVGPFGAVHAFEPVPQFHRSLERLRDNNPRYDIFPNRMALGAAPGVLPMAVVTPTADNFDNFDTNIGSSSVLPGFLDHEAGLTETIDVEVSTFDAYAEANDLDLDRIGLIKLDVEGYESFCFDGMRSVLEKPGKRIPILCEVLTDPARHEKLDGPRIVDRLRAAGYRCLDAASMKPIDPERMAFEENILCV